MADHDSTPPTAALSPEEWAKLEIDDGNARYDATFSHRLYIKPHGGDSFEARERHALAALCLYQQPFGFDTDADNLNCPAATIVEALRDTADAIDIATGPKMIGVVHIEGPSGRASIGAYYAEMFRACADRIAALLPEEPR